ncbi:helix-turn-helix domain-containing protein [Caldithrix abyssi]
MEMIRQDEVARRIEMIRRQQGLTQLQLARALHVSQAAISKYLKERIPPAEVLYRLARLGQTTVEWILTGEKTYWFGRQEGQVQETGATYDADLALAKKISALPAEARQAVIALIDLLKKD